MEQNKQTEKIMRIIRNTPRYTHSQTNKKSENNTKSETIIHINKKNSKLKIREKSLNNAL